MGSEYDIKGDMDVCAFFSMYHLDYIYRTESENDVQHLSDGRRLVNIQLYCRLWMCLILLGHGWDIIRDG